MFTHPAMDENQTRGRGYMTDGYSNGRRGATNKDRLVATCTQYLDDDLDIEAIHPSQRKTTTRHSEFSFLNVIGLKVIMG